MKRLILVTSIAAVAFAQTPAETKKSASSDSGVKRVTDAEELEQLLKKETNVFFLDVRDPKEIEELGSLKGYVNIPIAELEKRIDEVPKNKTIITA